MVMKRICILVLISCLAAPSFAGKKNNFHPRHNTRKEIAAHNWVSDNWANNAVVPRGHGNNTGLTRQQVLGLSICYLLVSNYVEGAASASSSFAASNAQFNQASNALTNTANAILSDGLELCSALPAELLGATTQLLANIVCSPTNPGCVLVEGNSVVCRGTEEEVTVCVKGFHRFDKIRETVIPVTPAHSKTKEYSGRHLPNLDALLSCLGFSSNLFANLGIVSLGPDGITLRYDSPFNIRTADNFLQTLTEESPFFKYVLKNNPTVIEVSRDEVSLKFPVFSQYCATVEEERSYNGNEWEARLPLQRVLQKIIAAVSGPVALEKAKIGTGFRVATLKSEIDEQGLPPIVEVKIFLDQSGSMRGERLEVLNSLMPKLLSKLQAAAKEGQKFNVEIVTFNDSTHVQASMTLSPEQQPHPWKPITAFGRTNLIPIGEGLQLTDLGTPQAVIAFTDGEHTYGDLNSHYEWLRNLQKSGLFSQPTICAVGNEYGNPYFNTIEEIFQGSVKNSNTVDGCMNFFLDNVAIIANPPKALVIQDGGGSVVVSWQGPEPVQTSPHTVNDGDTITFGFFREVVNTGTDTPKETREEKRARLLRELSEL